MSIKKQLLRVLAIPLLAAPLFALAEPGYSVTYFPRFFDANAVGNNGQVIGAYHLNTSVTSMAAIWASGEVSTYGLTGGRLNGISSDGRFIIGDGWLDLSESPYHPVLFENGAERPFALPQGSMGHAYAVNSSGQAVGTVGASFDQSGVIYSNGQLTYLAAGLSPTDINDAGVVVGTASSAAPGDFGHAMMYRNGEVTILDVATGATFSQANAINANGDIVGTGIFDGRRLPFLYSGGVMQTLGTAGGGLDGALDINSLGQVVGVSDGRAFLYQGGQMIDLAALVTGLDGWTLDKAYSINDAGQILAEASNDNGGIGWPPRITVLLSPISAVPEPSAWAMLLGGIAWLAWRRRRRATISGRARLRTWWAASLLLAPLAAHADPSYSLTFLPPTFSAAALGENGLVVGTTDMPDRWRAATWSHGTVTPYNDVDAVWFTAVSRNGMMTGSTFAQGGEVPFVLANGQMTDVGGGYGGEGRAINSAGQVAIAYTGTTVDWFLYYSHGTTTRIDVFGGDHAVPVGINEAGAVVGYSQNGPNGAGVHAFMYANGVVTDLGAPGDINYASAINDAGQIVGYFDDPQNRPHAFLYAQGTVTELDSTGYLGSTASDINNAGQIVGAVMDGNSDWRAFLLAQGRMIDLNSLVAGVDGWTITDAQHINDQGAILATACTSFQASCRNVLLTPLSAVPEPASAALLFCGLCLLAARSRHRQYTCQRRLTRHCGARR